MGWIDFAASVISDVLSWPIAVLAIVFVFRKPIAGLIGRIRTYEGLGQKLSFGNGLVLAESATEDVVAEIKVVALGVETEPDANDALLDDLERRAQENPSGAILAAWERLELAIGTLSEEAGMIHPGQMRHYSAFGQVQRLQKAGVINDRFVASEGQLHSLRNEVAHGRHMPTPGEAIAYIRTARELERASLAFAKMERLRRMP